MFRHILLASDFSPSAMTAAATARQLAEAVGARVSLISVFEPSGDEKLALEGLTVLREERFASIENVEIAAIPNQRPSAAICGHAMTVGADLIVAGRHGAHQLSERFIGSTTERVVRHAHCSVLVVEPTRHDTLVVAKHIVACTDFSEQAASAVEVAGELGRQLEAFVTLIHVYDLVPNLDVLREPHEGHTEHSFNAVIADKLEELQGRYLEGLPSSAKVLRDKSTVTAIVDMAGDQEVDLLVLSTHGRTGVARLLLGSVAERVVRHAPAPVLVVRR